MRRACSPEQPSQAAKPPGSAGPKLRRYILTNAAGSSARRFISRPVQDLNEVKQGLCPSLCANTTRPIKAQGRSRKDTAAPPTVCASGLPYMEGLFHRPRFKAGIRGSMAPASRLSSVALPRMVC